MRIIDKVVIEMLEDIAWDHVQRPIRSPALEILYVYRNFIYLPEAENLVCDPTEETGSLFAFKVPVLHLDLALEIRCHLGHIHQALSHTHALPG